MATYNITGEDHRLIAQKIIETIIKIDIYDDYEHYLDSILCGVISCSMSINSESDVRRTASLELIPMKKSNTIISEDGLIWINRNIKLSIGIKDLYANEINADGAFELSEALKVNNTLINLVLGSNIIEDNGAIELSEALKINNSLTSLSLSCNRLTNKSAFELSKALKVNTTLTDLDLGHNAIKDNGAFALIEALQVNTTLTNLDLSCNIIENDGVLH